MTLLTYQWKSADLPESPLQLGIINDSVYVLTPNQLLVYLSQSSNQVGRYLQMSLDIEDLARTIDRPGPFKAAAVAFNQHSMRLLYKVGPNEELLLSSFNLKSIEFI